MVIEIIQSIQNCEKIFRIYSYDLSIWELRVYLYHCRILNLFEKFVLRFLHMCLGQCLLYGSLNKCCDLNLMRCAAWWQVWYWMWIFNLECVGYQLSQVSYISNRPIIHFPEFNNYPVVHFSFLRLWASSWSESHIEL